MKLKLLLIALSLLTTKAWPASTPDPDQFVHSLFLQCDSLNEAGDFDQTIQLATGIVADTTYTCYNDLGFLTIKLSNAWQKKSNYVMAIEYRIKAAKFFEKADNLLWHGNVLNDIGYFYLYWEEFDEVISYYKKALAIHQVTKDTAELAMVTANLGFVFERMGELDSAYFYHTRALDFYEYLSIKIPEAKAGVSKCQYGLADVYLKQGNLNKAEELFRNSIANRNKNIRFLTYLRLAEIYSLKNDRINAYKILNQNYQDSIDLSWAKRRLNVCEVFYRIYKNLDDYEHSLSYHEKYIHLKDSIFGIIQHKQVADMQTKYETKLKDQEIVLLTHEKELNKATIQNQYWIIIATISLLMVILVSLIYVYRLNIKKKKAYRVIAAQNEKLINDLNRPAQKHKYQNSGLEELKAEELYKKLITYIEKKQPYLSQTITLNKLAKKLNVNSAYLSQVINSYENKNFNSFINRYRIEQALILIHKGRLSNMSIEGLAKECGFNSRVTFIRVFKTQVGMPPSEYLNIILEKENKTAQTI